MDELIFEDGSVPVAVAAKVYGKDPAWVRAGIISGWLPIGTATRKGQQVTDISEMDSRYGRINFYISPKLLYEETGYLWKGKDSMGTITRPELSKKNDFYVEKHRYYELKHFCLQYPIWKKAYDSLDGLSKRESDLMIFKNEKNVSDPTGNCAVAKTFYAERMRMIERACYQVDEVIGKYLLLAVTEELSYATLQARYDIPCCKDVYHRLYRQFFWLLNKMRN